MSERDIKGMVSALHEAIIRNNEELGTKAALTLLEYALVDLGRIAQALELIAAKPSSLQAPVYHAQPGAPDGTTFVNVSGR